MCCLQAGGEAWGGANSIAIVAGSAQADLSYLKSSSLQLWLFAYELPGAREGLVIVLSAPSCPPHQTLCHACPRGTSCGSRPNVELQSSSASFIWDLAIDSTAPTYIDLTVSCAVADTILFFTKTELHIVTSGKKGVHVYLTDWVHPAGCCVDMAVNYAVRAPQA